MNLYIAGTGSALPEKIVTNDDLAKIVDTSDEWIFSRTGIHQRHVASPEEPFPELAAKAALQAMEEAGVTPEDIGLIIVGTATADYVTPSTACQVQAIVGAVNAVCFDLNAACSGFLYSLRTAEAMMRTGTGKHALVIGGDYVTNHVDWTDRTTCVLFGDAIGAVVLSADETGEKGDILASVLGSDGAKGQCLTGRAKPDDHFLHMDGQEVFRFAVRSVPACISELLEKSGTPKEDIKYFILHQANARILELVAKRLKEPMDKFPMMMNETANTSAGSIPVLLDRMNREGKIKRGDLLVLSGFGGGMTWGAALIRY